MSRIGTVKRPRWLPTVTRTLTALLAPVILFACAASDGGNPLRPVSDKMFGRDRPDDIDPEYFRRQTYCPPVQVRSGTEAFVIYERGHDLEPSFVRHQASITRTARECTKTADGLAIKVGIAGRAVAGPKGGPGTLTLPIRVAVTKQSGGVLYSELFKTSVTIPPSELGSNFSQVVEQVTVPVGPEDRDLIVFVGFDEGLTG